MKINLLFLSVLSLIVFIQVGIKNNSTRTPAGESFHSSEKEILDTLKKVCDMSNENDSTFTVCSPYKQTKEKIEKEADAYTKMIIKSLTPEISALSGFILKSFIEQRVTLEVETRLGTPAVSISNDQTLVNWTIDHNF